MIERIEVKAQFTADDAGAITGILPFRFCRSHGGHDRAERIRERKAARADACLSRPRETESVHGMLSRSKPTVWHVAGKLLVDDVPLARELRALVLAGAVKGLSIGFSTKKSTICRDGGRTITALDLAEISLVTIPIHPGARVTAAKGASAAAAIAIAAAINRGRRGPQSEVKTMSDYDVRAKAIRQKAIRTPSSPRRSE